MARLKKSELLERFEDAVQTSGWNLLYLSENKRPARYQIYRDGESYRVKVYIWNITHGGATRAAHEYRIQITGIERFEPEPGTRCLILGWWEEAAVFAGWDVRQHSGALGASPSMQVSDDTLRQALLTGFAPYANQRGETAIAFRPDFAMTYIANLEQIHDSGTVPAEARLLSALSQNPDAVTVPQIEKKIPEKRKFAILSTKRALRALDFSRRVLSAYDHKCAMCGTQLRLVDGAHILPAAHPESTDETGNGVALCAIHHRAYDRGLATFDLRLRTHINAAMVAELTALKRSGGLKKFEESLRPILFSPADKRDHPSAGMVKKANALRGWSL